MSLGGPWTTRVAKDGLGDQSPQPSALFQLLGIVMKEVYQVTALFGRIV